jgi:hypothetical protein
MSCGGAGDATGGAADGVEETAVAEAGVEETAVAEAGEVAVADTAAARSGAPPARLHAAPRAPRIQTERMIFMAESRG